MKIQTRMVLGIALGLAALFWLGTVACDFVAPYVGCHYPEWSWQHGTLRMQGIASHILIKRIKPGMTFREVLDILGPGSQNWPSVENHPPTSDPDVDDVISFNLRTWGNDGIDVYFRNGRVSHAQFYD